MTSAKLIYRITSLHLTIQAEEQLYIPIIAYVMSE